MGSIEFNLSWNSGTQSFSTMTKLSSTYLFRFWGGTLMDDMADSSIASTQRIATAGLTGLPMAQPCICNLGTTLTLMKQTITSSLCQNNTLFFKISAFFPFYRFYIFSHFHFVYISISRINILVFRGFSLEAESLRC